MDATQPPVTCDTSDMRMIHAVLRWILADAERLTAGVPDGDAERARVVAGYVREISGFLHDHHHGEDEILWDRLEQRAPACAIHVAQMRADHARVAELLVVVETAVAAWSDDPGRAQRDAVVAALEEVRRALEAHLGAEEADILPVAATTFTQKEWGALAAHGRASTPPGRQWFQLGTMLEALGPQREALWGEIPPPVRLLYRLVGERSYRRERAILDPA